MNVWSGSVILDPDRQLEGVEEIFRLDASFRTIMG